MSVCFAEAKFPECWLQHLIIMAELSIKNKSLKSRFTSGAAWAFSGKIASAGSALLGNALLARLLSPAEMGEYFLAFSIVTTFALCGQWGLNRGLVKLVATELACSKPELASNRIISAFIIVVGASSILGVFLVSPAGKWVLVNIFGSTVLTTVVVLMGLWVVIKGMQGIVSESFRGFHDIRLATIFGGLTTAVIAMVLYMIVWLFWGKASLEFVIQITVIASGISLLIGLLCLSRKLMTLSHGSGVKLLSAVKFGFPLMITTISLFGVKEFHIWVLAGFQPESEVALYGSSLRLVAILIMPLTIVNAVIPPMVADLYSQNSINKLQSLLQKTATLISIPSFVVFVFIIIFGADALGYIYGEHYRNAFVPFVILALGQFLNVLTGSPGVLLTMSGHERVVMVSALISGFIGIVVSLFGVQKFGAIGAALGYSISIVLVNLYMSIYSFRELSIHTYGNLKVLFGMFRKFRAKIESDYVNYGRYSALERIFKWVEGFWWWACGCQIIECFGDSHVAIFRDLNYVSWAGKRKFRTVAVRGATAYGIGNPNSKTNALKIFQNRLKSIPDNRPLLFMMGEVDVGFLSWWRSQRDNIDVGICVNDALERYTNFLSKVKKTHPRLIISSVPLPTIDDGNIQGNIANARREVKATQSERTEVTLKFNRKLKEWAFTNKAIYLDFDKYALDEKTNLVNKSLINKNARDHHYDRSEFLNIIKNVINFVG